MRRSNDFSPAMAGHRDGGADLHGVLGNERREERVAPRPTRSPTFLAALVLNVPAIERACRLRGLAALLAVIVAPRPLALLANLRKAESDDDALAAAAAELDALPSLTTRHVISAWRHSL